MTLEEAERIMLNMDLESYDRFTADESAAVALVMTSYLMGRIDRERAARAMQCAPHDLPKPWRGNA